MSRKLKKLLVVSMAFVMIFALGACGGDNGQKEPVESDNAAEEPANEPVEEPANEPAEEPADEPAEEPADEPAEDPNPDQVTADEAFDGYLLTMEKPIEVLSKHFNDGEWTVFKDRFNTYYMCEKDGSKEFEVCIMADLDTDGKEYEEFVASKKEGGSEVVETTVGGLEGIYTEDIYINSSCSRFYTLKMDFGGEMGILTISLKNQNSSDTDGLEEMAADLVGICSVEKVE